MPPTDNATDSTAIIISVVVVTLGVLISLGAFIYNKSPDTNVDMTLLVILIYAFKYLKILNLKLVLQILSSFLQY